MTHPILQQVRQRIEKESIPFGTAAEEIGVTLQSLQRHLEGEYVRSDSIARYRLWLERQAKGKVASHHQAPHQEKEQVAQVVQLALIEMEEEGARPDPDSLWREIEIPTHPHRVVDIFSGCGGLSLGFERFAHGKVFDTTLALDIAEPMIRVFNDNHPARGPDPSPLLPRGRQADVTDFMNETEIQAFYLDHLARSGQDPELLQALRDLAGYDLDIIRAHLRREDQQFLAQLSALRSDPQLAGLYRQMGGADCIEQTSVIAFHRSLKLPVTALGAPRLETLLWADDGPVPERVEPSLEPDGALILKWRSAAQRQWDEELQRLLDKSAGNGKGQLSSSAKRIQRFVGFATSGPMQQVRAAWIEWRARRDALRALVFDDERVRHRLQALYDRGREVSILLGGPPCQGFSRAGRGKIRSLREQSVHVHEDEDSGDSRNRLLEQYVLFVSALRPRVFLFENVRHFQAVVRIGDREFDAAEALAEAIKNVKRGLSYDVQSQVVVASEHLVPQVRERYLMAGTRADVTAALDGEVGPRWCIQLPAREPIPLEIALEGLPEPATAGEGAARDSETHGEVQVTGFREQLDCSDAAARLRAWICSGGGSTTDGHIARRSRADDAAFFDLMGPGKRWMDYRCDETPTLARLKQLVVAVDEALVRTPELTQTLNVSAETVQELNKLLDGSLSLRLLLESIPPRPGETGHHLLAPHYLKKRGNQHGDWLSRMDPSRPSKTLVSHMAKDTYAYVHPTRPRTLSVREAARIQTFPDSFRFRSVGLVDGFRMIGNAVPPLLSAQFAERVAQILWRVERGRDAAPQIAQLHSPPPLSAQPQLPLRASAGA